MPKKMLDKSVETAYIMDRRGYDSVQPCLAALQLLQGFFLPKNIGILKKRPSRSP